MTVIERAIESAKNRKYKLEDDLSHNISDGHREKAERQVEVMNVTIDALEKQIHKKPIKVKGNCFCMAKDGEAIYEVILLCPRCKDQVIIQNHPCKCGQMIDWNNINELDWSDEQ